MNPSKYERKKPQWKDQTWRLGKMLHVGLTDSHVHEGLLNGVVVGHVVMFWHQKSSSVSSSLHAEPRSFIRPGFVSK